MRWLRCVGEDLDDPEGRASKTGRRCESDVQQEGCKACRVGDRSINEASVGPWGVAEIMTKDGAPTLRRRLRFTGRAA